MEVSALRPGHVPARFGGRSPLLRLQSDEKLVALVRKGNHGAFETLVSRYQARLAAFCRHMLGSREDAEDVLQEVFAAAFHALMADDRDVMVRPWLYRIARNRSLNHLRRQQPIGVDSMDVHFAEQGLTTADQAHRREEFRLLIDDVSELAETQRTALLLREMEHLSYEQISEAMETTVPAVKSLLVRARMSLAEASEARALTCDDVRFELSEAAEGLRRVSAPARRHARQCERCSAFRKHLRETNKALAAVFPVGPLFLIKKAVMTHFGHASAAGGGAAGAATAGNATTGGLFSGGVLSGGLASSAGSIASGAAATKAAVGLAAAAVVTVGAVEARHVAHDAAPSHSLAVTAPTPSTHRAHHAPVARVAHPAVVAHAEVVRHLAPPPVKPAPEETRAPAKPADSPVEPATPEPTTAERRVPAPVVASAAPTGPTGGGTAPAAAPVQTVSDTTTLPSPPPPGSSDSSSGEPAGAQAQPQPSQQQVSPQPQTAAPQSPTR